VSNTPESGELLDHLFRRQAGRIVAWLARLLGPARLDLAEDMAQEAMLRAMQAWPLQGVPQNPEAWLFRVAHNAALDALRREGRFETSEGLEREAAVAKPFDPAFEDQIRPDFEDQIRDDELRMIFMCCHPEIPREAGIALSLKTVGGFGVREIARAFLAEETAVAQRIVRAKKQIRERGLTLDLPRGADLERRLDAVLGVIYFLFNEGYATHEGEDLIRQDLCFEAPRLASLIAASALATPRVDALAALLAFQAARLPARTDEAGDLVLLEDQDRSRWDRRLIALGFYHFARSAEGDEISEYHVQAAIAAEYARATGLRSIDWPIILELYDQLAAINPSPVVALNRAVALAEVRGPAEAIEAIATLDTALRNYYLLPAVRGHLLLRLGEPSRAAEFFRAALECRCSQPERRFLERKLSECSAAAGCR
jgi:RNA polymerase sigma-70 factor (ECF subfamily)